MKGICLKAAAAALVIATSGGPALAQSSDDAFIQCMIDCQDWEDEATRIQCENWCYAYYNPY